MNYEHKKLYVQKTTENSNKNYFTTQERSMRQQKPFFAILFRLVGLIINQSMKSHMHTHFVFLFLFAAIAAKFR